MKYPMMVLAAAAFAASAAAAPIVPGTPITTAPAGINALGGPVTAIYIFADASHTDVLGVTTPPPDSTIFCNHALGGTCAANNSGDTKAIGPLLPPFWAGPLQFTLFDDNTGNTFFSNLADVDGNYHAFVSTDINDFGLTAAQLLAAAPGLAAAASHMNVTFVGWEDKMANDPNPDWDYNDLIFAFSATLPSNQVPEPLSLALVGAGLMGAFGLRRVKKS
jgi:hypothetical protein